MRIATLMTCSFALSIVAASPLSAQTQDRRAMQIQQALERKQGALELWDTCFSQNLASISQETDRNWRTGASVFKACTDQERIYVRSARAYADARRPPALPRRYGDPVTYTVDDHYVNHERGEWLAIRREMEGRLRAKLMIDSRCTWVTTNYFTHGGNACQVSDSEMGMMVFDFP